MLLTLIFLHPIPVKSLREVLLQKSGELNLFSAGDRLKLEEKHLPDARAVLDFWKSEAGMRVADLGTGGGLPGLALAEACPELQFTLMDATAKKVEAVKEVAATLGFKNVTGVSGRFEELAHEAAYRQYFDVVMARAVAELPVLLEYVVGFLKVGGKFYAWKAADYEGELESSLKAQHVLGLEFVRAHPYTLPSGEERIILEFEKKMAVSEDYPRKNGVPKNKPLA